MRLEPIPHVPWTGLLSMTMSVSVPCAAVYAGFDANVAIRSVRNAVRLGSRPMCFPFVRVERPLRASEQRRGHVALAFRSDDFLAQDRGDLGRVALSVVVPVVVEQHKRLIGVRSQFL